MSVTFTAEMSPITGYTVTCGCRNALGSQFGSYQDAVDFLTPLVEDESLRTALPGCDDPEFCLMYRLSLNANEADPAPSINVTSLNAGDLFRALGLLADELAEAAAEDSPFEGGSMTAAEFLGRVLLALAISPSDEGRPEIERTNTRGNTSVLCSRQAGYLQMRLAELHDLAQFAASRDRQIHWS